jgi:RNA polymerase sigma-70 factor (ECF subfamily)
LQQTPNIPDEIDEAPDSLAAELSHRALEFIQNEFEPGTWRAFWLTTVEGQTPADTARELGLTLGAVYKAKSRVLLRLRRELDGLLD